MIADFHAVAQNCNLLYRGLTVRRRPEILSKSIGSHVQPNAIRRYSRLQICATALCWGLLIARAEPPTLDGFFPAGAPRGSTNTVAAFGKFDSWPPKVWVSGPGITFTAETNKGKFFVIVAKDAVPGAKLVRLFNDEGASEPRFFVVGDGREITELEPNNHFQKPQRISELPITVNGQLDKRGDVDSFTIDLPAGETLEARVDCYTLMSKVDAVLRLMTTNGLQLAWNHDFATLDPRLTWRASNDVTVVLQIFGFAHPPASDIGFTGGESAAYRLRLAVTNRPAPICEGPNEIEPNNRAGAAQRLELPATIQGQIGSHDDEDRFQFTTEKNVFVEARVEAASLGSPLDAWIKFEDESGSPFARNDDADGSRDPRLEWKATNRNFIVAVGSVTHRGGSDACYRLTVRRVEPAFQATLGAGSLVLVPGATNELKLEVKRFGGFTNALAAGARGLPGGVTLLTTNLAQKDPVIRFATAADAAKSQGPIEILLRDTQASLERAVPFELTTRGETGYSRLLVETCDQFWLTVRTKPKEEKKSEKK